jgi:hypothetical protein
VLVGKRSLYRQSAISAWNAIAGPEIADQGGSRAAVASPSQALTVAYPALSRSDGKGERMLAIDGDDLGKAVAVDALARLEMPDAVAAQALRAAQRGSIGHSSLPGGHFFVDQFPQETADILAKFLSGK